MNIHETIYRLRTESAMSQLELAEALDVSRQSISKWETGAAVPELDKLVKLSDVFGTTLDELVRGTGEGTSEAPTAQKHCEFQPSVTVEKQGIEPHRIIALAVLCTGILAALLLLLISGAGEALFCAVPLIALGALFLALPRKCLLWGFWVTLIAMVWMLRRLTGGWLIALGSFSVPVSILSAAIIVGLVLLIVVTVRRVMKK